MEQLLTIRSANLISYSLTIISNISSTWITPPAAARINPNIIISHGLPRLPPLKETNIKKATKKHPIAKME